MSNIKKIERLKRDLRTGLLTIIILKILLDTGPLHGYGIRKKIEYMNGEIPPESSVYDALKRLERLGLAESYWVKATRGSLRKYYKPTPLAQNVLQALLQEAKRLLGPLLCD